MNSACDRIRAELGDLFTCERQDRFVRIRTPLLYPDGDYIDLFLQEEKDLVTLTDLGETTGWLRLQTPSPKRSPKQNRLIQDVCQTHGVEFFKGTLTLRVQPGQSLADAVLRLGQAAVRVSDLWFTYRTRAVESITDEVADVLLEREIRFERAEKLIGRSGEGWTVAFHTRTPRRSSLVEVLSTGSRGAVRGVVDHVVAQWHDLHHLVMTQEPLHFVSLFDDTLDIWDEEDFKRLEPLSDISRWSNSDGFIQMLEAA